MKKLNYFFLILLGLSVVHSEAEELNTILITGSRTGLDVSNKAASYVITQEDIELSSAQDLPGLLSKVPGVNLEQNGGRGSASSIRIRGAQSDHTLVLIDGVRSASATSGDTAIQFIPLAQIERIEIIKGPQSGLYGAEAIGGVIQIFTKSGQSSQGGYAQLGVGSFGSESASAGFNGASNNVFYGVNLSYFDSEGIDRTLNNSDPDTDLDAFDQRDLSVNFGYQALQGPEFDFRYLLSQGNTEFDSGDRGDSTDFDHQAANLSLGIPLSLFANLNIDFGYFEDDKETFGANPAVFNTMRDTATVYVDYDLSSNQSIVFGYDYYNDSVDSTQAFVEDERDNQAGFAEYAIKNSAFNLQLAYRYDDNEAYGKQDSSSASLSLPLKDQHIVTLSYGTAFKSPTFNDLYFPFTDFGGGFTYVGNPNLEPEESSSLELSYVTRINSLDFTATVYKTEIENLIELTDSFDTVENVSEAEIVGTEFSLSADFSGWYADFSVAYIDAKNKDTNERLFRRPRTSATLDIQKSIDNVDFQLSWLVEGDRQQNATTKTAGYGVVDIASIYSLDSHSKIKVKITNLFDKDYILVDTSRTYQTEGRAFEVSYKYSF